MSALRPASVEIEPYVRLRDWIVVSVQGEDGSNRHVFGYEEAGGFYEWRISSPIVEESTGPQGERMFTTRSGRKYIGLGESAPSLLDHAKRVCEVWWKADPAGVVIDGGDNASE